MIRLNQTTAVSLALAAGVLWSAGAAPATAPRVTRFLGPRAAQTLADAARVEVFRLHDKRAKENEKHVGGYAIEAAGAEQGEGQGERLARRVAALLLDEKSYRFDVSHRGGFKPTIGLRLWAKGAWVEVLVSPGTDEVVVLSPNPEDGSVRSAQADFSPARQALTALLTDALPRGG